MRVNAAAIGAATASAGRKPLCNAPASEVPGETNPLSFQTLCRALESATSHDFAQRQAAGQQLTSWEQHPGYYSSLQVCFCASR